MIYVYANNHQHAYGNLKYFLDNAVREGDGVDYIFIFQQLKDKEINETKIPSLAKSNVYYIQHENKCYDYGTVGWFFVKYTIGSPWRKETSITNSNNTHRKFNLAQYKYFIFMNASIRGPFFPPYFLKFVSDYQTEFNEPFYWYYIFTKRINAKVKLVGITICCEAPMHLQSYFLTTDFVGLSILLKTSANDGSEFGGVFGCYGSRSETIDFSELSIAIHIRNAGYSFDGLLTKYQKMDFSTKGNYKCDLYVNPYMDKRLDGTSLEPYEVVFVKYNDKEATTEPQERAKLYQQWMNQVNV